MTATQHNPISEHVARLRAPLDLTETSATQLLYEKWLKQDRWRARSEALPLLIGSDPDRWPELLAAEQLEPNEELVWQMLCNDVGISGDDAISVSRIVEWAATHSIALPPSFARIYEFVRKVLLAGDTGGDKAEPDRAVRSDENEIVLGAALSLLAKMPDRCRDQHGFVDGRAIAGLISETAPRWFPPEGPRMSIEQMAALIDRWLE